MGGGSLAYARAGAEAPAGSFRASIGRESVRGRVPVPTGRDRTGNGTGEAPALPPDPAEDAFVGEPMQEGQEGLLAHAERGAQDVAGQRGRGRSEERERAGPERIGRRGVLAHEARPVLTSIEKRGDLDRLTEGESRRLHARLS